MELPVELKFKDEDERVATIEKYEADGGSNPDDIQRIMDVAIESSEEAAEVVVDAPEVSAPEVSVGTDVPPEQQVAPEESKRQWSVGEDDIPKDTYFDQKEGKVRPFVTQKTFGDFTKSYISGQKRIHYLEDILLPQERQAAQAQYQIEIDRLKAENDNLKQAPAPQQAATPVPAAISQTATSPQPTGDSAVAVKNALEELKTVDPLDAIDNMDKMHKALMATLAHSDSLTESLSKIQQSGASMDSRFAQIETQRQADVSRAAQESRDSQAQQNWKSACQLVDSFAQTNPDFKTEFGQVSQTFGDMTKDAMDFHISLAGMMFNKHPQQVTNDEQKAASQAYLRGDEQLKQKTSQYGLDEPTNYKAWVVLDEVDAMRTGMFRDPISKQWQQILDPVSKAPVMLGEMGTAYGKYLDVTGKRHERTQALLKSQSDSIAGAIARRDSGITSMDTNRLHSDGTGSDMTEQQAVETLDRIDSTMAMSEYMRTGNKGDLELQNRAFARLGMQPAEIPDFTPDKRK